MPVLFNRVVVLDRYRHRLLRLDQSSGYGFAAGANALPLGLGETAEAAASYPVVFAPKGEAAVLAVLGYRDDENLFVELDGNWRKDAHVPAYVRSYPFLYLKAPPTDELVLAIDPDARCLSQHKGLRLFLRGEPSPVLTVAAEFCRSFRASFQGAQELCRALDETGLLIEDRAMISFDRGGIANLKGFRMVDMKKFEAVDDGLLLDWRKRGWLPAIYAHFQSQANWARIVDLGAERSAARA